jgi:hypothetical protein
VFASGECELARQIDIDLAKQVGAIQDAYIDIDLGSIVTKALKKKKFKTDYLKLSSSSLIENEIMHAITIEEVSSLSLKVRGGNEYYLDKEYILSSKQEMNSILHKLQFAKATTIKRRESTIYKVTEKKIKDI